MPRRPVVLLPGFDRNRQAIVFRRKRAGGIGCHRAGRAVSTVEVEYDAVTGGRGSLQKATTGIGLMLAGQVIKYEKQLRRIVIDNCSQAKILSPPWEYGGCPQTGRKIKPPTA